MKNIIPTPNRVNELKLAMLNINPPSKVNTPSADLVEVPNISHVYSNKFN